MEAAGAGACCCAGAPPAARSHSATKPQSGKLSRDSVSAVSPGLVAPPSFAAASGDLEEWAGTVRLNLETPMRLTRLLAPGMVKASGWAGGWAGRRTGTSV